MKLKTLFSISFSSLFFILAPANFGILLGNVNNAAETAVNYVEFAPPTYTDEEYKARVMSIPGADVLNFSYNKHVRSGIEAYTVIHRGTAESVLGLREVFFPIFEEALARHGVPQELRYLAVIESALKPNAKSPAGAAGLWQFISSTGKYYDLRIDSEVDERYDIYLASDAAARFLAKLHSRFGDWLLVIAAYNCGPGRVNSAIKKSGSRDIWKMYRYLPKETRGYVPLFIGSAYLMNYHHYHQLHPLRPDPAYLDLEKTTVYHKLTFKHISEMSGTPMYQIEFLNPSFRKKYIPDNSKGYALTLPRMGMAVWRGDYSASPVVNTYTPSSNTYVPPAAKQNTAPITTASPPMPIVNTKGTYTPPKVSTLASAPKPKAKPKPKVKYVNDRIETPIGEREKVKIKIGDEEKEVVIYEMKRGDNLSVIASRYPGVSVKDIIRLNNIKDYRKLRRGTRLYIGS